MKKGFMLLIAVFMFSATAVFSQVTKLPEDVAEAFKNKFPEATNVIWNNKQSLYKASFTNNKEKWEVSFTAKGDWQKTERDVEVGKLAASVTEGFTGSKYSADWKLVAAHEMENSDGRIEYRMVIEKAGTPSKYIYMNLDGQVLREAAI